MRRTQLLLSGLLALAVSTAAFADSVGFIARYSGSGHMRVPSGAVSPDGGVAAASGEAIQSGDMIVTGQSGSVLVRVPDSPILIHLGPGTEAVFSATVGPSKWVAPVSVTLRRGSCRIVNPVEVTSKWVLVGAATAGGEGYVLIRGGSGEVRADAAGPSFSSGWKDADDENLKFLVFKGKIPAGPWVDDDGEPLDAQGVALKEGEEQTVSVAAPLAPVKRDNYAASRFGSSDDELYSLALGLGGQWVRRAEQGDFTPVRSEGTATLTTSLGEFAGGPAFDQARALIVVPSPATAVQQGRVVVQASLVQVLLGSGNPADVVTGRRIERSRIIGDNDALRFNPQAGSLIELAN